MKLPPLFALLAAVGYSAVPGKSEPPKNMMAAIPLHFEPNVGQTDPRVSFTARGSGMSIFVTPDETVLARRGAAPVRMKLRGGKRAKFEPFDKLPGVSNYYRGNDPKKWREGVPHYARVRARNVYEGIDVVYYGNGRRLEYDFVVAPGADASKIELSYEGAESMRIDGSGDLVLVTKAGELRQRKPTVYQQSAGRRVEIEAGYRISGGTAKFALARYDTTAPLVIDPILEYGTVVGGIYPDESAGIAVDSSGVWVAGAGSELDYPLVNAIDTTVALADASVTKLDPSGTSLVFSTFFGGTGGERVWATAIDGTGNFYIAGATDSWDLPLLNPAQSTMGGYSDWFITGLSPAGTLVLSTYVGGNGVDTCFGIAVTANGIVGIGLTNSDNFYSVPGVAQRPVIVRLSPNGSSVLHARTLTGAEYFWGVALDSAGAAYITGSTFGGASLVAATAGAFQPQNAGQTDAFVAKLHPAGHWQYVTHLGGSGIDAASAIAVDASGQAWVAGGTLSQNFPVKNAYDATLGNQGCCEGDGFLTVLNAAGSGLVFSTFLGGSASDSASRVVLLPGGGAAVLGASQSSDFPIVAGWKSERIRPTDPYFAKFTAAGALEYSSFFGVAGDFFVKGIAAGPAGTLYFTGEIRSPLPPGFVTPGAYDVTNNGDLDIFVLRFGDGPPPVQITVTSNPPGREVFVDGRLVTTPATFSWMPGSQHSLNANSQQVAGNALYTFSGWSHGGAPVQTLTAPNAPATYNAVYSTTTATGNCAYGFAPSTRAMGIAGGSEYVQLVTATGCRWTPGTNASWITVETPPSIYVGNGVINYRVDANLGGPRSGTITAGSGVYTITQPGGQGPLPPPTIISPTLNQFVNTKGVQASWTQVSGATGYEVRIQERTALLPVVETLVYYGHQAGVASTGSNIDLPDGLYTLYVRTCSGGGTGDANCGAYNRLNFSVNQTVPGDEPTILTPADGQTLSTSTNVISWTAVPGATSYEVTLVDQVRNRTDLQITTPTTSTIFTMRSSSSYFLTVQACAAKCSLQRARRRFSVVLPVLSVTPPTGLTTQITGGNTLNLSWNPVLGADLYRVQVVQPNAGPGGGALTVAARQVSTTNASLQVPAGAATVVLNACNGDGCGPPSTIAVNPTGPNPSVPIVATPMPVVVADGPNITISWSRIPGDNGSNTDYRLYVGDLSRDGPALDVITKNNFYGAFLRAEGRRYDALVFATQNGVTVTGPASGFMVAGSSATAPLITSPTHNSTFKQGPFRLAWSPIPDAVRYQYYVGRQGQSGPVLTGVTPGIFVDTTLSVTAPTLHQAIVRACPSANASQCSPDSDAGWGPWSQSVTGTTSFTITP